ncbi:hypothetical protein [Roseomonas sp. BN140053]|uniref:hypothetical protein n=1 Tax=Roseomonas sp. BN140053 TaxID=3391898 RepID=UPI0039EB9AA3
MFAPVDRDADAIRARMVALSAGYAERAAAMAVASQDNTPDDWLGRVVDVPVDAAPVAASIGDVETAVSDALAGFFAGAGDRLAARRPVAARGARP